MNEKYYTVDQIAEILSIHPKTIQRYIREGKLGAAKIGKSWRVSGHDLSIFTEENSNTCTDHPDRVLEQECVMASSVIDIKVTGKDDASRISNSLSAAMNVKPPEYGSASMHTQFIEQDYTLRITLWGNIKFMSAMISAIEVYADQYKEELK